MLKFSRLYQTFKLVVTIDVGTIALVDRGTHLRTQEETKEFLLRANRLARLEVSILSLQN